MKKLTLILLLFFLIGCTEKVEDADQHKPAETIASTQEAHQKDNTIDPVANDLKKIDYSLKPREHGKIMVLMYHNIGDEEEEWVRTPANFRKDLQTLYDKGYRPIRLRDYVKGNITTPAGLTPVVITVDDAGENNFRYLENGEIDPNCLVGILLDFQKEHPDFPLHVTFFANGPVPFRQEGKEKEKIDFLLKHGMDLGNHTRGHEDLSSLSAQELQETIGSQAAYLESLAPKDYKVNTLALPFGSRPDDDSLAGYLEKGVYKEQPYHNIAVLNVGWDPWYSPFHKEFNPLTIHRVRASETNVDHVGLYDWLDYFDKNPDERYVSDGYPHILTVPKAHEDEVDVKKGMVLNPYTPAE